MDVPCTDRRDRRCTGRPTESRGMCINIIGARDLVDDAALVLGLLGRAGPIRRSDGGSMLVHVSAQLGPVTLPCRRVDLSQALAATP